MSTVVVVVANIKNRAIEQKRKQQVSRNTNSATATLLLTHPVPRIMPRFVVASGQSTNQAKKIKYANQASIQSNINSNPTQ